MKRSASLIILVAGTLFASCSSLQTISFDQLHAARNITYQLEGGEQHE